MAVRPADPRSFAVRARRWTRRRLFGSAPSGLLTVVTLVLAGLILVAAVRFLLSAEWGIIEANRRLIFIGLYPSEEEWRLWPPLWLLGALAGLSYGLWSRITLRDIAFIVPALLFVFGYLAHGLNGALLAVAVVLAGAGYLLAWRRCAAGRERQIALRAVVVGWALFLPFTFLVLWGFGGVPPARWGGFYLNLVLASVGIGGGFPAGVLLALGRASSYPAIKLVCTVWIEFVRGAPLVAWLFFGWFVLPAFLPGILGLNGADLIVRVMIILALFTGAYIAEIVRGGLQSVPRGQVEAASALGMGTVSTTLFIVLPQALRAVIPALVSQFITLWKDTTLVSILPVIEALSAGKTALAQSEFFGRQQEMLLFIAFLFWVVAMGMSRLSYRLERNLGIGTR